MTQSIFVSSSPPRTPTRSIIRPLDNLSITPTAISDLSQQIENLIQRGKKLRDLRNSMSVSSVSRSLHQTRASVFESSLTSTFIPESPLQSRKTDNLLNATDPLFSEYPSQTRMPAELSIRDIPLQTPANRMNCTKYETKTTELRTNIDSKKIKYLETDSLDEVWCSFEGLCSDCMDRNAATVRLRTNSTSGERVKCCLGQEVSIEIWNRKTIDLIAMGRLTISGKMSAEVDCYEVWDGGLFGSVTLSIKPVASELPGATHTGP